MGENGKRYPHQRDYEDEERSRKRKHMARDGSQQSDLVVYRILCPHKVIGLVIGKSGKVINAIRRETNSRVKVVDPFPGCNKRVIIIYCYVDRNALDFDEDNPEPLCGAQEALLRVHDEIVNAVHADYSDSEDGKGEATILVPSSQAATIIGKAGSNIRSLRTATRAHIKVDAKDPKEPSHSCAMSFDNFVKIRGEHEAVRRALLTISTIMLKFPHKESISLETSVPEAAPSIIIPSDLPIYSAGGFYHGADSSNAVQPRHVPVIAAMPRLPEVPAFTDAVSAFPVYPSAVPVISGSGGPPSSGEVTLRVLCPCDKIGRVIGRGGSTIKGIRKASGALIDVDDKDNKECILTITSTESTDDIKSGAVEAVLLLQKEINDDDEGYINFRLLVPQQVVGRLIGKGGEIVNEMRKKSRAEIRIAKGEKPRRASIKDELVEVIGNVSNLREALVQIILRLREGALKDIDDSHTPHRDKKHSAVPVDQIYTGNLPLPTLLPHMQSVQPLHYDQRVDSEKTIAGFPGHSLYGYNTLQAGDDAYSAHPSYQPKAHGGGSSYMEMVIPANALSKVMGKEGTNLDNIRKISGARIEIYDSRSSRFERIARISGTAEQKQSAENLIKAFIMST